MLQIRYNVYLRNSAQSCILIWEWLTSIIIPFVIVELVIAWNFAGKSKKPSFSTPTQKRAFLSFCSNINSPSNSQKGSLCLDKDSTPCSGVHKESFLLFFYKALNLPRPSIRKKYSWCTQRDLRCETVKRVMFNSRHNRYMSPSTSTLTKNVRKYVHFCWVKKVPADVHSSRIANWGLW